MNHIGTAAFAAPGIVPSLQVYDGRRTIVGPYQGGFGPQGQPGAGPALHIPGPHAEIVEPAGFQAGNRISRAGIPDARPVIRAGKIGGGAGLHIIFSVVRVPVAQPLGRHGSFISRAESGRIVRGGRGVSKSGTKNDIIRIMPAPAYRGGFKIKSGIGLQPGGFIIIPGCQG